MDSGFEGAGGKRDDCKVGAVLRGALERETGSHRSFLSSWMSPGFEGPASEEGADA